MNEGMIIIILITVMNRKYVAQYTERTQFVVVSFLDSQWPSELVGVVEGSSRGGSGGGVWVRGEGGGAYSR